MPTYLSTEEVAEALGVTQIHVCWLIRHGKLRSRRSRDPRRTYEVSSREVDRYARRPHPRGRKPRKIP